MSARRAPRRFFSMRREAIPWRFHRFADLLLNFRFHWLNFQFAHRFASLFGFPNEPTLPHRRAMSLSANSLQIFLATILPNTCATANFLRKTHFTRSLAPSPYVPPP